jgi:hypothetical protein
MGAMCTDAEKYLDTVLDLYPSQIYFTYGMNDVDGSWDTLDGFISAYKSVIRKFMDNQPYAEFYVCSIIPVNQHAIDNDANYTKIPEYNAAMKQMTEDLGLCWIDCDHLLDGHEDYYDTDGQHFFPEAYPLWARHMLKTRFEYESGRAAEEISAEETEYHTQRNRDERCHYAYVECDARPLHKTQRHIPPEIVRAHRMRP